MGMALKFNCFNCGADVYTKHLKIGEQYKCKSCLFFRNVPKDAQSINESEIPNTVQELEQNQKERTEQVNGTTITGSKYPALKTMSGFYNFLAFLSIIIAVIGFFYGITLLDSYSITQGVITMIISIVYGLIAYLVSKAIAEGILLSIDIANDLNELKTNLLSND